jgi:protocatechuate 3,4-dioxygenase beta subunit
MRSPQPARWAVSAVVAAPSQAHDRAMPDRREILVGLSASFAALLARSAWGQSRSASCVLTPVTSEGPYYFDPRLVRSDITEKRPGVPLTLDVRVVSANDCAPIAKARVDIWHADASGVYSGYSNQYGNGSTPNRSAEGKTYLRGTQFADGEGLTSFRTIFPSWYRGRTPHIHFKVFLEPREVAVSQLYFPDPVSDRIFSASSAYNARRRDRDTFNAGDMFLRSRTGGAFCEIAEHAPGYRASVVIGIDKVSAPADAHAAVSVRTGIA